jgi:hypothetical protein
MATAVVQRWAATRECPIVSGTTARRAAFDMRRVDRAAVILEAGG